MEAKHENPFETLSELELNSPSEPDLISEKEVFAELRFSEDHIDVGGYDITVSLARATLHLHAWGSSIAPGSRLAEESRIAESSTQRTRKRETAKQATESSGHLTVDSFGVGKAEATTKIGSASEGETEVEVVQTVNHRFVRPTSGNRWIISEGTRNFSSIPLDGTYVANDILCKIKPKENVNSVSVEAIIVARKSDIIIEAEGNPLQKEFRERLHRHKFHRAIIAKCLSEYTGQEKNKKTRGRLILSRSTLEIDPNVS